MSKKCIICGEREGEFVIKDTSDVYCKDCAMDCFSDLSFLQKVEEQAASLKEVIKEEIEPDLEFLDED